MTSVMIDTGNYIAAKAAVAVRLKKTEKRTAKDIQKAP